MTDQLYYNTIAKHSFAEFKDRGSKFVAYAYPIKEVNDFKKYLQGVKKEHPKAVHHCFAYRVGTNGNNYRVSDDGEPAGSAGKPILGQIDSKQLINVAVIVARYFGGTLLGIPGLINAYKSSAALALQLTPIIQQPITIPYELLFNYTIMNDVMHVLKMLKCEVVTSDLQLFCNIKVNIPKGVLAQCMEELKGLQGVEIKPVI